jgi:hypothetical protein
MTTFRRKTPEENVQDSALPALEVVLAQREGSDGDCVESQRWHHLQLYERYFASILASSETPSSTNISSLVAPLPKPKSDDWLAQNDELGQSLSEYIAKCRMLTKLSNCSSSPTIALAALGRVSARSYCNSSPFTSVASSVV